GDLGMPELAERLLPVREENRGLLARDDAGEESRADRHRFQERSGAEEARERLEEDPRVPGAGRARRLGGWHYSSRGPRPRASYAFASQSATRCTIATESSLNAPT